MTNTSTIQPTIEDRIRACRKSAAHKLALCESIREAWRSGRGRQWTEKQVKDMEAEARASWQKANALLSSGTKEGDRKQLALL